MATLEVLYFAGCPAYRRARERALAAIAAQGGATQLKMTLVRNLRDAAALNFHGSPTVRLDGRDIDPQGLALLAAVGLYSRPYKWKGGAFDAPPEAMIREALAAAGPAGDGVR